MKSRIAFFGAIHDDPFVKKQSNGSHTFDFSFSFGLFILRIEHSGYAFSKTNWVDHAKQVEAGSTMPFYDSNTGKLLFTAPKGRTMDQFLQESKNHGWPSFRDEEVNWEYVRCLPDGESVSVDGTHLGHNLPDKNGNRVSSKIVFGKRILFLGF